MNRPAAAVVLMLALLLQGLASAWAAPMVLQRAAPPATSEVAPPCHEHAPATASSAAKAEPAHGGRAAMNCCDDGIDCTHCSAACGTPPVPLATIAQFDDYIDAHFALILRSDAVLLAHPLGLLRPPITFHG